MRVCGTLEYSSDQDEWVIWFESVAHETFDGMHIEM